MLDDDALRKLLATASTKSFLDVRDMAIMRLFVDTGMRLGEMAGLELEDIDRDHQTAYVMGKGRRPRVARSVPNSHRYALHAPTTQPDPCPIR